MQKSKWKKKSTMSQDTLYRLILNATQPSERDAIKEELKKANHEQLQAIYDISKEEINLAFRFPNSGINLDALKEFMFIISLKQLLINTMDEIENKHNVIIRGDFKQQMRVSKDKCIQFINALGQGWDTVFNSEYESLTNIYINEITKIKDSIVWAE